MRREWKPGDVALIRFRFDGSENLGIRVPKDCAWFDRHEPREVADHWHMASGGWSSDDAEVRPLVVMDPEDREQVKRLLAGYYSGPGETVLTRSVENMQAALREYLAPPKPDEPTGQGAVVEDAEGNRWVRRITGGTSPWMNYDEPTRSTRSRQWSEIAAVRVLSEGVQ